MGLFIRNFTGYHTSMVSLIRAFCLLGMGWEAEEVTEDLVRQTSGWLWSRFSLQHTQLTVVSLACSVKYQRGEASRKTTNQRKVTLC